MPTVSYATETWSLSAQERRKIEVLEVVTGGIINPRVHERVVKIVTVDLGKPGWNENGY